MRTTVTLAADVAAAIARRREERHIGISEALNELVREGLVAERPRTEFRQRVARIGVRIDVTNVARALDELEGPAHR